MSFDRRAVLVVASGLLLGLLLVVAPVSIAAAAPQAQQVTYVVQPGDRLVDIAARYGVSAGAIMAANDITNADLIFPGQRLVIPPAGVPAAATPTPAPAASPPAADPPPTAAPPATATVVTRTEDVYHTVAAGETLDVIARRYGVSASAVIRANGLANPDMVYVGQRLLIPTGAEQEATAGSATPRAPAAVKPAPIKQTIHVVQAGDTLARIAQKYGVPVSSLVQANALGSADVIRVGQRLVIPGKGVTTYPGRATKFVASISEQRCWLYQGESMIADWSCSTGRPGSTTRPGSYKIQSKLPKAFGSTWNIWMPYCIGIYWAGGSENGIHGLPWNASTGVQVWTGYVGTPITYGCLMLDNANAKLLYDMADIGMPVIVKP